MKKILMILTSHEGMEHTDSKTGVWLGEFTDPYYELLDHGCRITLASPAGGQPPIDPMSKLTEHITESNRRFQADVGLIADFAHTYKLASIDPAEFDAVFFPGGHGPLWDLASNPDAGRIIVEMMNAGKPVAAVCHGPAALISAAKAKLGFLEGKRVTGFTNTEEALVMRSGNIPYHLETRLKELGADFHSALIPMTPHVEIDGLLVTGQNPLSAGPTAKALIEMLGLGKDQS
ncbi:type 1 glutamine amidotransferase domain-containing protein [Pedobacter xixiisoli]|uniref:Intracellular protease/amidase n=1 Tax=Pedobacter xixiisoli TaxID=1476464 RepID=A0A285ZWG8_9SPHI|nr:type 1 glutamine amidotransferase domain-containing protein [Pedobacter xixiisoli]SOD13980.1 Putative intracellular protease/amidase [Pedobacter xixiisoli]